MMFKWIQERREAAQAEVREAAQTLADARVEAHEASRRKQEARALANRLRERKEENGFGPLLAEIFTTRPAPRPVKVKQHKQHKAHGGTA